MYVDVQVEKKCVSVTHKVIHVFQRKHGKTDTE